MKEIKILISLLLFCLSIYSQSPSTYPFMDKNLPIESRINDLVERMTLEEKIDLLAGYNDFYLHPCERLGIPAFKMADGPLGVSSWGLWGRATAYPSALSLASSWNRNLAKTLGERFSKEWRARGIHFMLAPGVNIYRASKGARNFEYYGEDPYLTSEMIVPFIKAVQDGGVIATVKHFVGNDQEFDRYRISTEMSERALHEIYLPPFKAAVLEADVKAVMTGYNPFRGVYCTENKHIIDILKKDWGFKGMLMSDWACTYSADKAANYGLDLEMGSKNWFNREKLLPLIEDGTVSIDIINDKVKRIYGTCMEMGFFDRPQKIDTLTLYDSKANDIALKVAEEGIILLKNDNNILPLDKPKTIAVIGPTANPALIEDRVYKTDGTVYGGGGCSRVHPWYVVNDLQGITNVFKDSKILYDEGISNDFKRLLFERSKFKHDDGKPGLIAKYYNNGIYSNENSSRPDNLSNEQAKAAGKKFEKSKLSDSGIGGNNSLIQKIDKNINFEWWKTPDDSKFGSDFMVEWSGYIDIEKNDSIRFFVDAQGGYQLWLDDSLYIDAIDSQSFHYSEKAINVSKGDVLNIRLLYNNQRAMPAEIRMGYFYDSELDFSEAKKIASMADVVIFSAGIDGSIEMEGRDRPFDLPFGQDLLIKEIYKINPNIIVVLHAGGGINMTKWIDKVPAVLHALYPGQEGGNAIARILSGIVNPSAKLPFTIEKKWEDSPAFGNYDETRKDRKIYYNEGIFTGYRGYEINNINPLFAFGHGLSYTSFEYDNFKIINIDKKNKAVELSVDITNTGERYGAEIVQFYISDIKSKVKRPVKELKGFEKVWLKPNETKTINSRFNINDFMYFSEKENKWIFESGNFIISAGTSSNNIKNKIEFNL